MTGAAGQAEIAFGDLRSILTSACLRAGCDDQNASSLVQATLSAQQFGAQATGVPHFVDYLEALEAGRIDGRATPRIASPLPAMISVDAGGGLAQTGFDLAFDSLVETTRKLGVALFTQSNSYTSGELGYYVRRLAAEGLVALAATNGPALMTARPGGQRVYCTNPLAFAAPGGPDGGQVVVDQASSATAFVKLVKAASAGEQIPEGWAIDAAGNPTSDAAQAIEGALLPFGGSRGANIALIVELLAAGLSGANWSLDAGDFRSGGRSPAIGLTVVAIAPPPQMSKRVAEQMQRLGSLAVYVPGKRSANKPTPDDELVQLDATALAAVRRFASKER